jgi:hypothetical protein
MSFDALKKDDLLKIADDFGVDIKPTDTKAVIIAALAEDGVTWEQAAQLDKTVADIDADLKEEASVARENGPKDLLKMSRANGTFEVRGYKFTKQHPFGLVDKENAEWIVENIDGFNYATPKEAQAYYG